MMRVAVNIIGCLDPTIEMTTGLVIKRFKFS